MGARRFSSTLLTADTNTVIVTGQTGYDSTINIIICNQGANVAYINLAYLDDNNPSSLSQDNYFMFNEAAPIQSRLEVKGLALESGKSILIRSTQSNVSVVVHGFEEQIT